MNLNEAIHICRILDIPFDDVSSACIEIAGKLGVTAVVHTLDQAYAADRNELQISHGELIEMPVVSTGGGDHFNAGYCCALIKGRTLKEALQWGNRSANNYVSTGKNMQFFGSDKVIKFYILRGGYIMKLRKMHHGVNNGNVFGF